jgi:hypothetical protein
VTALDVADLVVIAGRTLGIGTDAALAQMDIAAARDALAEARSPRSEPGAQFSDRAAAAAASIQLVRALQRHRPFPRHGQQMAVAAGLQLLSLNGWCADLNPAATAAVVVEALASGRLTPDDAAAWLSPRLSPVRRARRLPLAAPRSASGRAAVSRSAASVSAGRAPVRRVSAGPVPLGRAVAGALLAVAVTGVTLLAAACSRGPAMPAVPSGGASAVRQSAGAQPNPGSASAVPEPAASKSAPPADLAYARCMRGHGVGSFPYPSASGTVVIAPAAAIDPNSPEFRSAETFCRLAVPTAAVRIIEAAQLDQAGDAKLRWPRPGS